MTRMMKRIGCLALALVMVVTLPMMAILPTRTTRQTLRKSKPRNRQVKKRKPTKKQNVSANVKQRKSKRHLPIWSRQ